MTNRLEAIYAHITDGKGVIDVGTDHGCIPITLAKNGYAGNIFASDINVGPLSVAKRASEDAGTGDRICFFLCDGLDACPTDKVDTIVIAGMGGDLICDILDRAEWCMSPEYTLILQPMTKVEILRYWLVNNEFAIVDENLAEDGGVIYQILTVSFGKRSRLSDAELFTGEFSKVRLLPLFPHLLKQLTARFESAINGLHSAKTANNGKEAIYSEIFHELKRMKQW